MAHIFALVDCDNFYVSCERVFNPKLSGKPVVVLSNNDGCIVSRSNEAKAIGIKMGTPLFKAAGIIEKYGVLTYSSNYALYGDMSGRVMQTIAEFTPDVEIYSIDEAFLDLSGFKRDNLDGYGRKIGYTVRKRTGIPVSVGIAETKTLAKIAGRIAKKSKKTGGVLDLYASPHQEKALCITAVEDIWGIGRSYSKFLRENKINNALELRNADDIFIKKKMGITGLKTVYELRGTSCYPLEYSPPAKKGITISRTFKHPIKDLGELKKAISTYTSTGAVKLRAEHSVAGVLTVFLMTSRFDRKHHYFNMEIINLPVPTCNTTRLIQCALKGLEKIYRKGYRYKKGGVIFKDLLSADQVQLNLFEHSNSDSSNRLMDALDEINSTMGPETLKYGATGLDHNQKWKTLSQKLSPSYTTDWRQLPEAT